MRRFTNFAALVVAGLVLSLLAPVVATAQTTTVGFQSHRTMGRSASNGGPATCCKAESKLWYHDGTWWATMIHRASSEHRIHRLDGQTWVDTGVRVDDHTARADVLHQGNRIWVTGRNTSKLARFTYASGSWSMDGGFPVDLPVGATPGLTIARDSAGTLWIAWLDAGVVRTSRSTDDGASWSSPAALPFPEATNNQAADYAAITAFTDGTGPAVGVMWSNQNDDAQYFAVHRDGAAPDSWSLEVALEGTREADDHINFATFEGEVYATVKTDQGQPGQVLVKLLKRSAGGTWTQTPVAEVGENDTRPIGVIDIDPEARRIYVFNTATDAQGLDRIVYRSSPLSGLGFPTTATTIIQADQDVNNVTSMKASATAASGIVIMAETSNNYWWNRIGGDAPPPAQYQLAVTTVGEGTVAPPGGTYTVGTAVTLMATPAAGWSFDRWSGAAAGLNPTTTVVMDGDKAVTATFVQDPLPQYDLTVTTEGSGTVSADPAGGTYDEGTTVTLTASPATGWAFDGWGGAASGTNATTSVVMDGDRTVTATFVPLPPDEYALTVTTVGSGTVALDPPQGPYEQGTTVTLTASPADGWSFDRWSGAASGTAPLTTVVMNGDRTVTATFVEDGTPPPPPPPPPLFGDLDPASTHADAIVRIAALGITEGCAEGRFCPDLPVTRAQMASFLQRTLDLPLVPADGFDDVEDGSTHAGAIGAIRAAGITLGCTDDGRSFCPNEPVGRDQLASFLQRALELPDGDQDRFGDVVPGTTHAAAIGAVAEVGITLGCTPDGRSYCPHASVSRAQMASFLDRTLDYLGS